MSEALDKEINADTETFLVNGVLAGCALYAIIAVALVAAIMAIFKG